MVSDLEEWKRKSEWDLRPICPEQRPAEKNSSGVRPVEYNVVVRPDPVKERTAGGLYIPDEHREREQHAMTKATVVAMSAMAYTRTASGDEWIGDKPEIGSRVMIGKYSGRTFEGPDKEMYRILKDEEVIGIIDGE